MFSKKVLPLVLTILFVTVAVGCSQVEGEPKTAAIVNGKEISISDYEASLEEAKLYYQQQGMDFESEEGKGMIEQLEKETLDNMINQQLLQQEIEDKGYRASEQEIDEKTEEIKSQYDEDEFQEVLKQYNLTESKLKEQIANQIRMEQYTENEFKDISVTEEELRSAYDAYSGQDENAPDFDEIKQELEQQVKSQKIDQGVSALIEELRNNSEIEILL